MGKTIQTGGIGKNPAIEKINQLSAISSRMQAVSELEKKAFLAENSRKKLQVERRKQIIDDFHINFRQMEKKDDTEVI